MPGLTTQLPNGSTAYLADVEASGLYGWATASRLSDEHQAELLQIHREAAEALARKLGERH